MILPEHQAKLRARAIKVIEWLDGRYDMWGKPDFDRKSSTFWEMIFDIIKVWENMWPTEMDDWKHDRAIDLELERSLQESVKHGLKKTMAYPPHLFKLLKAYWPNGKLADREFTQEFMKRYPIFRNSNYT